MGLGQSLRAVVEQFGGAPNDYDDYDEYDSVDDDALVAATDLRRADGAPRREWGAKPLALVRPPRIAFSLVAPQDFDDAQQIADHLRAETPVIVDLRSCAPELSKRLIDFCSGLTYARDGSLEFLGDMVVLLAPPHVELSSDSLGGLQEGRFYNRV